ncbi:hypothetical protein ACLVWQ_09905 (plasmid) [Streptomyces sp. CWNU-52B]|uniref:hypothetical protein n=1 Tax=unclassified Streptomyces TaxID=2593676 RepID=UPI0039C3911D
MRTILAGVFAAAAILGSAGSALATDHDGHRNEGDFRACGQIAGAGGGHAFYGNGCVESHWAGEFGQAQFGNTFGR